MFDKNLFKKGFTDDGTKIVPAMASDWVISDTYKNNCVKVSSPSQNISFDLSVSYFIRASSEKSLQINANKIEGSYIFDSGRRIHTEQEFYEWEDKLETLDTSEIKKADLVRGEKYKLASGKTGTYLGTKFMSRLSSKMIEHDNVSKITKKHLFLFDSSSNYYQRTGIGLLSEKVVAFVDGKVLDHMAQTQVHTSIVPSLFPFSISATAK